MNYNKKETLKNNYIPFMIIAERRLRK